MSNISEIPKNLKYANTHEWVRIDEDNIVTVGITDYAQASLGDITYIQLRSVGDTLDAGEAFGVIESVKAASDVYSPVCGRILTINDKLKTQPEMVNQAPFDDGWLIKVAATSVAPNLLTPEEYHNRTR